MSGSATPSLILRPSDSRGHAEHGGWLQSYHTFNFGSYYSEIPREQSWNSLKVVNEDRVAPGQGFPTHQHQEFEIFSYIVDGEIEHRDSITNVEVLRRGDVQMTSAGTGIRHSEYNGGKGEEGLHFLQCWAKPDTRGLKPRYYTRNYTDAEKTNVLLPIVAPLEPSNPSVTDTREGSGPTPIHSPLTLYASILTPTTTVSHVFATNHFAAPGKAAQRKGYLHLIMRAKGYRRPGEGVVGGPRLEVRILGKNGEDEKVELEEGDGVYLDGVDGNELRVRSVGEGDAEFLLFDLEAFLGGEKVYFPGSGVWK